MTNEFIRNYIGGHLRENTRTSTNGENFSDISEKLCIEYFCFQSVEYKRWSYYKDLVIYCSDTSVKYGIAQQLGCLKSMPTYFRFALSQN